MNHSPSGTKRIVFFGLPPVREIDLIGAVDVFATANQIARGKPLYDLKIISAEPVKRKQIAGMFGVSLSCDGDYRTFKMEVDTLLIPGGLGVEKKTASPAALHWLRKVAKKSRRVGSICTGTFLLAQAGLLDGRRVTTHWRFAAELAGKYPKVQVDPDPIWIQDGNYYTTAGVTSGIDLSLALVEDDHGAALALDVARMLVVFLKRPGNQTQFSMSPAAQKTERRPLHELQVWLATHLSADLPVETLAKRVAMSRRNFQRVFTTEMGIPPARYIEKMRIDAARRYLERTTLSLDEIADRCGFGSADVMGRVFVRVLRATPGEYRGRFRSSGI
jgi:transcriptional regulator GlxA family with amidase domain